MQGCVLISYDTGTMADLHRVVAQMGVQAVMTGFLTVHHICHIL